MCVFVCAHINTYTYAHINIISDCKIQNTRRSYAKEQWIVIYTRIIKVLYDILHNISPYVAYNECWLNV